MDRGIAGSRIRPTFGSSTLSPGCCFRGSLHARISANAVSVGGLALGALAALAYSRWYLWPFACAGLLLSMAWLVADGLDGMIARATGTASPLGRFLDGVCDHCVFVLIYLALAASIGTLEAWILAGCAAALHALQSSIYEGERARFHRRCMGVATTAPSAAANLLERIYDRLSHPVESDCGSLRCGPQNRSRSNTARRRIWRRRRQAAAPDELAQRQCPALCDFFCVHRGDPRLYWWFEILPLTAILGIGIWWHRAVEARLIHNAGLKVSSIRANTTRSFQG